MVVRILACLATVLMCSTVAAQDIWLPPREAFASPKQSYRTQDGEPIDITKLPDKPVGSRGLFVTEQINLAEIYEDTDEKLEAAKETYRQLESELPALKEAADAAKAEWDLAFQNLETVMQLNSLEGLSDASRAELRIAIAAARKEVKARNTAFEIAEMARDTMQAAWDGQVLTPYWLNRQRAAAEQRFVMNLVLNIPEHKPGGAIHVRLDSRFGKLYQADFEEDETTRKINGLLLVAGHTLEILQDRLDEDFKNRQADWRELLKLSDQWQKMHDEALEATEDLLLLDALVETIDAAASVLLSENPARALAWEVVWRGGKAVVGSGENKVKAVKLPERLIEARRALAETEDGSIPADAPFSDVETAKWVASESERRAKQTLANDAVEFGLRQLFDKAWDMGDVDLLIKQMRDQGLDSAILQNVPDDRALARAALPNSSSVMQSMREVKPSDMLRKGLSEIYKGAVTSLGTGVAKKILLDNVNRKRFELEVAKISVELDYFVVRNRLNAGLANRAAIYRLIQTSLTALDDKLQTEHGTCCSRERSDVDGAPAIAALEAEYDEEESLTLTIRVDRDVPEMRFKIGSSYEGSFSGPFGVPTADFFEYAAEFPVSVLGEEGAEAGVPLELFAGFGTWDDDRLDGDPVSYPILSSLSVRKAPDGYNGLEVQPDKVHLLPHISPKSGVYVAVADIFGLQGFQTIAAPNLKIRIYDADGELAGEAETGDTLEPVFIKLPPGSYQMSLDTASYIPVYSETCVDIYVRPFELAKNEKLSFTATVRSVETDANGTSYGFNSGECIRQKD